jgi:hypothetical protein
VSRRGRSLQEPWTGALGPQVVHPPELTELRAAGEEWWTLGFEAFGNEAELVQALTGAVADFFSESALADDLQAARSCAYPAWLRTLGGFVR